MNKVQKLFQELGHEEAIKFLTSEPLNIKAKEYAHFYVLNYCQIFSPETDDYVLECRSLQIAKDCTIISRAFPRFFNYGQRPEITGKFDFDSAVYLEKCDGSMIRVYWNPFELMWEIATRGTAYAESTQDYYPTFRQAVIEDGFGFKDETEFQDFCNNEFNPDKTYVFEFCSLRNRIVTPYEEPQMVLLAVIDNETGAEALYDDLHLMFFHGLWQNFSNIRLVKRYQFNSYDEMKDALDNLPDLQEGFVAQDKTGLRVKFKNDLYLKLHKMRGDLGFTPKKIASVVAEGEEQEVLTYFGQYRNLFEPIIKARDDMFDAIHKLYSETNHIESQKEFALAVKDTPYAGILFNMRKGTTFQDAWNDTRECTKVDMILREVNKCIIIQ